MIWYIGQWGWGSKDAQFGHKIGSKHLRGQVGSRSIGCSRERLIFGGIESISKKFWRYLSFEKLCPKAFSVSWGCSSLRCVTNFRRCGHKSYFELKCFPLDTKVNHPFEILKILFQHVPRPRLSFWKVLVWICFICVFPCFDELG